MMLEQYIQMRCLTSFLPKNLSKLGTGPMMGPTRTALLGAGFTRGSQVL